MYKQKNNDSVETIGSVISAATGEFEEVLKQIENQQDTGQKVVYLKKFIRTLKQKIKRKGFKPKLTKLLQKAYFAFRK